VLDPREVPAGRVVLWDFGVYGRKGGPETGVRVPARQAPRKSKLKTRTARQLCHGTIRKASDLTVVLVAVRPSNVGAGRPFPNRVGEAELLYNVLSCVYVDSRRCGHRSSVEARSVEWLGTGVLVRFSCWEVRRCGERFVRCGWWH
jgi:hypothetical protein